MNTKISVIIPVYNMEKYLGECLESVLHQTLSDIQIICIDDGSTDNTPKILEEYRKKYSNIIVLYQNRRGSGSARNKGLEYAKGKYIAFMDSDDYYASNDVLEALYNCAVSCGVKVAGGNILRNVEGKICKAGKASQKHIFEQDAVISFSDYQFCWGYTCFIYDREMLKQNGIFFPSYIRGQDPPFMLKALSCADKMGTISRDIYVAREFDKKIKFNSINIINDMARYLYDIIIFSMQHNYTKLIEIGIQELLRWKIYFFMHIIGGNTELQNILQKLNAEFLRMGYNKSDEYYIDMSVDDMKVYIEKYSQEIAGYVRLMERYKEIIIYGAGNIGKLIFDLVEKNDNLKFLGFAVSSDTPEGTARGMAIHCINTYLDKKDKSLVVIAAMKGTSDEMERNAERLGFKNRLIINNEIIDIKNFEIINDKFAI